MQPGTRLGPYEVVAPIGSGGMGEVYRARDTRLGRDVAIKVLLAEFASDPDRLRRFEQEARAVAALDHPNILAIHDVGSHEDAPYIVTELLEGESLSERLQGGALPVRKAVEIGVQIAQGLAAAHARGIVHRDLKPGNVFLTNDGVVKILDFGLAKLVAPKGVAGSAQASTVLEATEAGTKAGTVGYMSPEQVRGQTVDHRTDIFAFGCVLYEMLSGRSPFGRDTAADTASAILHEDPLSLTETKTSTPPAIEGIVIRCLEKQPADRFSSAHDLALALQSASSQAETAAPNHPGVGLLAPARWRRLLLGESVLAIAAIVVGVAIWRPWHGVSAPMASGPGHTPSILALPCKVYGAPEVAFLADAVPGTISTLLAQVEGLDTKVPPSSFEVEKIKGDLTTLADLYQVSSFIVTSINASAEGFALNVQIVDATTRKVRWGKQYEGPREAYNELARQAAEGIRLAVKPAASPVPTGTISSEAELAFRQGMYYFDRYDTFTRPADFEGAVAAFTRALDLDPSFAIAAGKVAELYAGRLGVEGDVHYSRKQTESWARRALGIDPRCGEAWAALSNVDMNATHLDSERNTDYALKAVNFAPRDASVHANLAMWMNSFSLGLAASLRSLELDPFLLSPAGIAVDCLCLLGRPGEALAVIDRALKVEPDWPGGLAQRGFALTKLGRLEEADSALRRCEPAVKGIHILSELWRDNRIALAVAQRDTATSEALARQILASVFDKRAEATLVGNAAYIASPALVHMGRTDDAIKLLQRSVEVNFTLNLDWLLVDPDIQLLRGDPRFAEILAASREGALMDVRILAQARARGELPSYLNGPLDQLVKLLKENGGAS